LYLFFYESGAQRVEACVEKGALDYPICAQLHGERAVVGLVFAEGCVSHAAPNVRIVLDNDEVGNRVVAKGLLLESGLEMGVDF
jgi:hypothetical protein